MFDQMDDDLNSWVPCGDPGDDLETLLRKGCLDDEEYFELAQLSAAIRFQEIKNKAREADNRIGPGGVMFDPTDDDRLPLPCGEAGDDLETLLRKGCLDDEEYFELAQLSAAIRLAEIKGHFKNEARESDNRTSEADDPGRSDV